MTKEHTEPQVALVVLSWNGRDDTLECLASLTKLSSTAPTLYVVDNGSTDGTVEAVAERFPDARILRNETNEGFSAGCNRGIRQALDDGAEYVGVLNNDVVVRPDFLAPLIDAIREDPEVGAVGPKVLVSTRGRSSTGELEPDGVIWAAGASLGFHPNLSKLRGHGALDRGQFDRAESVAYVPGCAVLAPRRVWQEVGLFNTAYFAYMEDVEWCLRVRRHGMLVLYEPRSVVYHEASSSTGGGYSPHRKYMNASNTVRFLRSYGDFKLWSAFLLIDCLMWPVVFLAGLFTGRWRGALSKARGILDGLRGVPVAPPEEGA